jgi:FkbM family methyltransferase
MIRKFLVEHFPSLGRYKRFGKAWYDKIRPAKTSYSQHREDIFIWEFLQGYDLKEAMYVDVGANHPSDISNSYLLYRKGLRGVVIEPNQELIRLLRRFRKGDIALAIGCSNKNTVLPFHISKTPVLSSFTAGNGVNEYRTAYLPVMQLDQALQHIPTKFISLLSIDVEGMNLEVLQGAGEAVRRSLLICLEYDSEEDKRQFRETLGPRFEQVGEFGCNLIFSNRDLKERLAKR